MMKALGYAPSVVAVLSQSRSKEQQTGIASEASLTIAPSVDRLVPHRCGGC